MRLKELKILSPFIIRCWRRYWLADARPISVDFIRIFVCLAVYLSLKRFVPADYTTFLAGKNPQLYQPDGILSWFGSNLPAPAFFETLKWLAYVFLPLTAIGFMTRLSHLILTVSVLCLDGLNYSFINGWTNGYTLVWVALIALTVQPRGVLSVDYWLGKKLSVDSFPHLTTAATYLSQYAVASVFFWASFSKLTSPGYPSLGWIFSDNLRNQIFVRYIYMGEQVPPLPLAIANSEFLYKLFALGNCLSQAGAIAACFLVRRPILRALVRLAFVFEIFGLAFVMELRNFHWLPLYAVFIDWEYFLQRAFPKLAALRLKIASSTITTVNRRIGLSLVTVFIATTVLINGHPKRLRLDLNSFPFSRYELYGDIRAKSPLSQHQTYEMLSTRIELKTEGPDEEPSEVLKKLNRTYRHWQNINQLEKIREGLKQIRLTAKEKMRNTTPKAVYLYRAILQAPAYPEPLERSTVIRKGLSGVLTAEDHFYALQISRKSDPTGRQHELEFLTSGYQQPAFTVRRLTALEGLPGVAPIWWTHSPLLG